LYHISANFRRILGVYAIRIFLIKKMPHKTDMASQTPIEVYTCDASGFPCECDCVITGIIVVAQFIETSLLQKAYNLGCT